MKLFWEGASSGGVLSNLETLQQASTYTWFTRDYTPTKSGFISFVQIHRQYAHYVWDVTMNSKMVFEGGHHDSESGSNIVPLIAGHTYKIKVYCVYVYFYPME